jgi:hypothetical protein
MNEDEGSLSVMIVQRKGKLVAWSPGKKAGNGVEEVTLKQCIE